MACWISVLREMKKVYLDLTFRLKIWESAVLMNNFLIFSEEPLHQEDTQMTLLKGLESNMLKVFFFLVLQAQEKLL